jgi:hypothetical protein
MVVRGKVKKGKVVLADPKAIPDGTDVEVRPVKKTKQARSNIKKPAKARPPRKPRPRSLAERMAPFIGIAKDMPPDLSVNLDHYLYGHPKQK